MIGYLIINTYFENIIPIKPFRSKHYEIVYLRFAVCLLSVRSSNVGSFIF